MCPPALGLRTAHAAADWQEHTGGHARLGGLLPTPTALCGITLVSKTDGTSTKLGFTASDVAPVMRALRAQVEVRGQ